MTAIAGSPSHGDDAADRVRHCRADEERAQRVEDCGEHHGLRRLAARVATSVAMAFEASCTPFVTKGEHEPDRDGKPRVHGVTPAAGAATARRRPAPSAGTGRRRGAQRPRAAARAHERTEGDRRVRRAGRNGSAFHTSGTTSGTARARARRPLGAGQAGGAEALADGRDDEDDERDSGRQGDGAEQAQVASRHARTARRRAR